MLQRQKKNHAWRAQRLTSVQDRVYVVGSAQNQGCACALSLQASIDKIYKARPDLLWVSVDMTSQNRVGVWGRVCLQQQTIAERASANA